jgi:RNA recognition motif-containing protein
MASPYDNIPGKIFIGGISPTTAQETIFKHFEQYGELSDCVLMQDKQTGKSRGFGFVTYKDSRKVNAVLLVDHVIDGKTLDCKRAVPRDQGGDGSKDDLTNVKTKKLFVGGLPQNLSMSIFKTYFEQYGKVEDIVIMMDKETGKSRGFGFVTFENEDSVDQVIDKYYDNKIDGKWVECKKALPREPTTSGKKTKNSDYSSPKHHSHSYNQYSKYSNQNQGYYSEGGNYNPSPHEGHRRGTSGGYSASAGGGDYNGMSRYQNMPDSYGYYGGSGYVQSPVPMQTNYDPYMMGMGQMYPGGGYKNQQYGMMGYNPNDPMGQGMNMGMNPMMMPSMQGMQPVNPMQMASPNTSIPSNTMPPTQPSNTTNITTGPTTPLQNQSQSTHQNGTTPPNPNMSQGMTGQQQPQMQAYAGNPNMSAGNMGGYSMQQPMYMQNMGGSYYPDNTGYSGGGGRSQQGYGESPSAGPMKRKPKTRDERYYKPYPNN